MRYQISGKQMDVGEALQTHIRTELAEMFRKYAQRPTDATIIMSREGSSFSCEATVHLSTGFTVAARGQSQEAYAAFETCRERMDKQMRRYKRRLRDHHDRAQPVEFADAAMYVLSSDTGEDEDEAASLQPIIIAETGTRIPALTVGEAVMQMELAGAGFLVFRNGKHGRLNVVHRREDGNVGWIDPSV